MRGSPNKSLVVVLATLLAALPLAIRAAESDSSAARADVLVAQLRELPTPMPVRVSHNTPPPPSEILRSKLYAELSALQTEAVKALARGYGDPDVRMRRNVALALTWLGGGYDSRFQRLDMEAAFPALVTGLADSDADVRAWSAQAIAHLRDRAKPAVPNLITMLGREAESDKLGACGALRSIGADAQAALPALRESLMDPAQNVRWCVAGAIRWIDGTER